MPYGLIFKATVFTLVGFATILYIDLLIPGVITLLAAIAYYDWKLRFFNDASEARKQTELNSGIADILPMARVTYEDGEVRELLALDTDFKITAGGKVYYKEPKRHNRWEHEPHIEKIEFYLHEFDDVLIANKEQ